jgi:hypothetical protein
MDNSHRGVSFFRIALIGLLLASVWVTVRRFRSGDASSTQHTARAEESRLTVVARSVSLSDPDAGEIGGGRKIESLSDSDASTQSYVDFLMTMATQMPSAQEDTLDDPNKVAEVDLSNEQAAELAAEQANLKSEGDRGQSIEPAKNQIDELTEDASPDPQVVQKSVATQVPESNDKQTADIPSDFESDSLDELLVEDEVEPESEDTCEDEATDSLADESLEPESILGPGKIQSNPFATSGAGKTVPQAPSSSRKK